MQQQDVMQAVQQLRRRADEAGNLSSSDRLTVERAGQDYLLASPSPETMYVPYYDPRVVYGSWWWPNYQPVYWNPWPGYGYYGVFGWGHGIALAQGFFYGGFDWGRRHVRYSGHRPYYYHGGHGGRNGRDDRRDGRRDDRRYSGERAPLAQPRYERRDPSQQRVDAGTRWRGDNTVQHFSPAVRSAAPRYNIEGARVSGARQRVERPAGVQQAAPVQRAAPVQSAARVQSAAPQSNPAARAAQQSQRIGASERRGGESRESRGRDR
jgi:pyruvate/2-oxoglutarate dehydrogenase complex dihydrolipoamide acyltransferase (E2) component